jgi:hypothetical protein
MEYLLEKVNASVYESSRATVIGNKKLIVSVVVNVFPRIYVLTSYSYQKRRNGYTKRN